MAVRNVYTDLNLNGQSITNATVLSGIAGSFEDAAYAQFGFAGFQAIGLNTKSNNLNIFPGVSTGNALGSDIIFGSSTPIASGSDPQSRATRMTLKGRGALLVNTNVDNGVDTFQVAGSSTITGQLKLTANTASVSQNSGSLIVTGGVGISENLFASRIRASSISSCGIRQSILIGSQDVNGFPNALTFTTGLTLTLNASSGNPFIGSFASGFSVDYGSIDFVVTRSTNLTTTLPANSNFTTIYLERNISTNGLTLGHSGANVGYAYQTTAPLNPPTNMLWFDLSTFLMKRWDGSAWVTTQRLIIGEAVTNATQIVSVITYAYRGFYASVWLPVVANTDYLLNHNLGVHIGSGASINVYTSVTGNDNDAIVATPAYLFNNAYYGYEFLNNVNPWKTTAFRTAGFVLRDSVNAWQTTGFYKIIAKRLF